ncbi:MAG: hypothetical protein L0956_07265 [Candidatus Mariimomonas ferrooxydans]
MKKYVHEFEVKKEFHIRGEDGYMRVTKIREILEKDAIEADGGNSTIIALLEEGTIIPHNMPETAVYEVLRSNSFTTPEKVISLKPGDLVTLSRENAISFMLNRFVRPTDKLIYYP